MINKKKILFAIFYLILFMGTITLESEVLAIQLDPGHIYGYVTDSSTGNPIYKAKVTLYYSGGQEDYDYTDSSGRYDVYLDFPIMEPVIVTLKAEKTDYNSKTVSVVAGLTKVLKNIALTEFLPPSWDLNGVVLDEDTGLGAIGAVVGVCKWLDAIDAWIPMEETEISESTGAYSFSLETGLGDSNQYLVYYGGSVSSGVYKTVTHIFYNYDQSYTYDVTLTNDMIIQGTVKDSLTGFPLSNFGIQVSWNSLKYSTTTDVNGNYELTVQGLYPDLTFIFPTNPYPKLFYCVEVIVPTDTGYDYTQKYSKLVLAEASDVAYIADFLIDTWFVKISGEYVTKPKTYASVEGELPNYELNDVKITGKHLEALDDYSIMHNTRVAEVDPYGNIHQNTQGFRMNYVAYTDEDSDKNDGDYVAIKSVSIKVQIENEYNDILDGRSIGNGFCENRVDLSDFYATFEDQNEWDPYLNFLIDAGSIIIIAANPAFSVPIGIGAAILKTIIALDGSGTDYSIYPSWGQNWWEFKIEFKQTFLKFVSLSLPIEPILNDQYDVPWKVNVTYQTEFRIADFLYQAPTVWGDSDSSQTVISSEIFELTNHRNDNYRVDDYENYVSTNGAYIKSDVYYPMIGPEAIYGVNTIGSGEYSYHFMRYLSENVSTDDNGEITVQGYFRQDDILPVADQPGRRYMIAYVLDATATTIITSYMIMDYTYGTDWHKLSFTITGLIPNSEYKLGFGRRDAWSRDWELAAYWADVIINPS